jgi:DNA-binding winged helix-turn-helix (wHTH) protein/tetratricopeptide (TPR) repeat protein
LLKGRRKLKLQEQPFKILAMLLERAGDVVTREELRKKLWSDNTFVDFDHGINMAIAKIREELGDSAERPKFVETLGRRGYKFIAAVEAIPEKAAPSSQDLPVDGRFLLAKRYSVGRERERAELAAAFESVAAGCGMLVCVAGEPGIGKTTLVEDFLFDLRGRGHSFSLAKGRCSERLAGAEAYLPILETLGSLLSENAGGTARTLRELAPTWYAQLFPLSESDSADARLQTYARSATQERVKREIAIFLEEIARVQPLILFLDDLHWADSSTTDLLAYLATKFDSMRMLIVAAYRPSDLFLSKHPFIGVKRDLQARSACREINVEFLSSEDVGRYLSLKFAGSRFPRDFVGLIHSRTEGSPLFMVDLLRYLRDCKVIIQSGGEVGWRLTQSLPDLSRDIPQSVRSMIERKIEQLSDREREFLVAAAVEGYEFDSASVACAIHADSLEAEERPRALERVHAFVKRTGEHEFPDGTLTVRYRFVHVLYQNELYSSLDPTRRTALSTALARSLEASHGDKCVSIASQLGFLYETARDSDRASNYFGFAAQTAARRFANHEVIELSRRALELLMRSPDTPARSARELELQLMLAFALQVTRGFAAEETRVNMARAQDLCTKMGDTEQMFPIMWAFGAYYCNRGDMQSGYNIMERLLNMAHAANDPLLLMGGHAGVGVLLTHQGEIVAARRHHEECSKLHNAAKHGQYVQFYRLDPGLYSLSEGARSLWLLGYPDHASAEFKQILNLGQSVSHPQSVAIALVLGADHYRILREPEKTIEITDVCVALCNEQGIPLHCAWAECFHGWAIAELGETDQGVSEIRASLGLQLSLGAEVAHPQFGAVLAEVLLHAGRVEEGLKAVDDGLDASGRHDERYYDAELWRLKGELLKMQDKTAEADSCFNMAIAIARRQAAKSWELRASVSLARLRLEEGKREEAQHVLRDIYAWFTEGFDTPDLREAAALLKEVS